MTQITIRYLVPTDDDTNRDLKATMESPWNARTDHEDRMRSKELIRLAKEHCPKGFIIDEVGDFDERLKILYVYLRTED